MVHDIPLLAESGRADTFDAVIVVDVPDEIRIERMVRDRGWTREDAESRIAAQASREDRLAIATHVIDNSGTLDELRARVAEVYDGAHSAPRHEHAERVGPVVRERLAVVEAVPGVERAGRREELLRPGLQADPGEAVARASSSTCATSRDATPCRVRWPPCASTSARRGRRRGSSGRRSRGSRRSSSAAVQNRTSGARRPARSSAWELSGGDRLRSSATWASRKAMMSAPWRSSIAMCTRGSIRSDAAAGPGGPCGSLQSVTPRTRLGLVVVGIVVLVVQPAPGGGERRPGARRDPRRAADVRRRGRCAHLAPGGRLRRLRRAGAEAGPGPRSSSPHPARPRLRRGGSVRAQPGSTTSSRSWRSRCWPWPGWRRPTSCCRRWSSTTSRPGRRDDGGVHDVDGHRNHPRLGAHGADQRRVRRLAVRADGLVADRGGRGRAVGGAAPARTGSTRTTTSRSPHRPRRGGPDPAGLVDGGLLRPPVVAGLLDLRLVSPPSTATPGSPPAARACCSA